MPRARSPQRGGDGNGVSPAHAPAPSEPSRGVHDALLILCNGKGTSVAAAQSQITVTVQCTQTALQAKSNAFSRWHIHYTLDLSATGPPSHSLTKVTGQTVCSC